MKTDLRDYFDFIRAPVEVIRLKDTRVNIEFVVQLFQGGMLPEQIKDYFGMPLTLAGFRRCGNC